MIDIVITYVYERDKKWTQEFNYYKQKEILEKKAEKTNRQAFGVERTREWDILKYWFRAVEKNCTWVNKIFLVVQNERHIPKWIDKNNPKLRIVFHDEYIPKELLPTFNAMPIGFYISNIKDLSNNYIMCDDDYYFLNKIEKDRFFKENKPVHKDNQVPYKKFDTMAINGVFWEILNNDLDFEYKITGKEIKYGIYHLPEARNKEYEQDILNKYAEEIKEHFITSKFRHKTNLCSYMFSDLLKIEGKAILDDPYTNCRYVSLKSDIDFNEYANNDIVCFNDTEILDDYNLTKKKLTEFLEKKFPEKSSYEV